MPEAGGRRLGRNARVVPLSGSCPPHAANPSGGPSDQEPVVEGVRGAPGLPAVIHCPAPILPSKKTGRAAFSGSPRGEELVVAKSTARPPFGREVNQSVKS